MNEDWISHMPVLSKVLLKYPGNILEFGTGFGSSFLICSLSQNYRVLSFESNKEWFDKMKKIGLWNMNTKHSLHYVNPEKWDSVYDLINKYKDWNIAFIDHAPGERRSIDIEKLKNTCQIIIFHDSQESSYGYNKILSNFRYIYTYDRLKTSTTVVSNIINVKF